MSAWRQRVLAPDAPPPVQLPGASETPPDPFAARQGGPADPHRPPHNGPPSWNLYDLSVEMAKPLG